MYEVQIIITVFLLCIFGILLVSFRDNNRIRDNLVNFGITFCVVFYFYYVANTIYKIMNSTIRVDRDIGDDNIAMPLYRFMPLILFAILSLLQIVILFILYMKDGLSNPSVLLNFFLKTTITLIILNVMLYLLKRGYYITAWVIGLIPIVLVISIVLYTIVKLFYKK